MLHILVFGESVLNGVVFVILFSVAQRQLSIFEFLEFIFIFLRIINVAVIVLK